MTPYNRRRNPYIRRMAEDMQVRNLAPATIDAYTYHVDKFCHFFGKSAEQLGPDEIRQYQLYLVNEKKASWSSFNQAVCGLRFSYEVTLGKGGAERGLRLGVREPEKEPIFVTPEHFAAIYKACDVAQVPRNLPYPPADWWRALISFCYMTGWRISEPLAVRREDIDLDAGGCDYQTRRQQRTPGRTSAPSPRGC